MPNKLEDIEPDEISLVDVPATKRMFLFRKADVAEEDRIIPNGIITCPSCDNQEALVDFVKSASEECPECGENLLSSDTEITFKKRRLRMKKKLSEILKAFLEEDDEELTEEELDIIEKAEKALDPDAKKALKGAIVLLSKYKGQYPDDVKSAINILAKFAAFGAAEKAADEDDDDEPTLKKAGAKLSKDTVSKLKKIFALMEKAPEALKLLKDMLPESAKKSDVENKMDEILEEISELKKAVDDDDNDDDDKKKKKKKVKKDDDDDDNSEIMEKLESLEKIVNKIAKAKGMKKSIDGNDDDDDDDDVKKGSKKWSFSFASPNKTGEED